MKIWNRKIFTRRFVFLVLLLSFHGTYAAPRIYTTIGSRSCEKWTNDASTSGEDKLNISYIADLSWLAGYVTGVNRTTTNKENLLKNIDLQTISDWVDLFCKKNSGKDIPEAIDALFEKLKLSQ